jgi:hypothetical protein
LGGSRADPLLPLRGSVTLAVLAPRPTPSRSGLSSGSGRNPGSQLLRGPGPGDRLSRQLAAQTATRRRHPSAARRLNANNVTGKRYEDHFREAGFKVEPPVKNQGRGAASMRIEAVRRLGPQMWFNEIPTEAGRDALAFYHERNGTRIVRSVWARNTTGRLTPRFASG